MDLVAFSSTHETLIITAVFFVYVIYVKFIAVRVFPTLRSGTNQPLLNAYYTKGKRLTPLHKDSFGSLPYVLYMTTFSTQKYFSGRGNEGEKVISSDETIICCVTLPFKSACHLVGITKNGSSTLELRSFVAKRGLEQVVLEGDFPQYAYLYSPPGNQVNTRYLMDPSAMAYVADFCKTHHWEIVGRYLYFVSSNKIRGDKVKDDPTPIMTEDVERFVEEIKPALVPK